MRARLLSAAFLLLAMSGSGCGQKIDLSKGLEAVDVTTGWWDAGLVNGQNKLVPTVTFKFKNVSNQKLGTLQANVIFRRAGEHEEWGSGFVRIAGGEGLPAGETSAPQTVKSQLGYTGIEPRQEMLANSQFVDAKVELFAKYESTQWQLIAEYPISRRLIAP